MANITDEDYWALKRKVKGKQKTYIYRDWTIKVPRKGSKLDKELDAERKKIKAGKAKYKKLDL